MTPSSPGRDERAPRHEGRRRSERGGPPYERLWALVDAGVALSSELHLDAVLKRIVAIACDVLGARYGALGVVDESRTGLSSFVFHGLSEAEAERIGHLPVGKGLLGALITDPRPIRLERLQDDPRSTGFPAGHPPMRTFLGVPVVSKGEIFGNLYLTEKAGGHTFTEEDQRIAIALAGQAGVAVQNARLFEEAQGNARSARLRLEQMESVQEMGAAVLTELDPGRVLRKIAFRARDLVGAHSAIIAMADRGSKELRIEVAVGRGARTLRGKSFPVAGSLSGLVLRTRRVALTDDAVTDDRAHFPIASAIGARSAIFAPLLEFERSVGVLAVAHGSAGRFDREDVFVLQSFAHLASLALRNARLLAEERQRAEVEAELAAMRVREEMRSELLRRVIWAQEEERRRIARDLHDSAGQAFTSILLGLKVAEQEKTFAQTRARLADLRDIASEAAAELRRLALELRPTVLDDLGLVAALERYARDFHDRTGVRVVPRFEIGDRRLPPEVETVVYRVVQESLTNVAKHAEAEQVRVALTTSDGTIRLRVRDDGRGFDPDAVSGNGLGLQGMQERADAVDGKLKVRSTPGRGTTVELEIAEDRDR